MNTRNLEFCIAEIGDGIYKMTFEQIRDAIREIETLLKQEPKVRQSVESLETMEVIFNYYDETFKDTEWSTCCSGNDCACRGMPCDPEYYICELLKSLRNTLKKILINQLSGISRQFNILNSSEVSSSSIYPKR